MLNVVDEVKKRYKIVSDKTDEEVGYQFTDNYHIDNQAGLLLFSQLITEELH